MDDPQLQKANMLAVRDLADTPENRDLVDRCLVRADGLIDRYAAVGAKAYGTSLLAVYHDFDAEEGSLDHGEEWNLRIARGFFDHLTLALRYATYSAKNTSVDIDKLWATAQIKF